MEGFVAVGESECRDHGDQESDRSSSGRRPQRERPSSNRQVRPFLPVGDLLVGIHGPSTSRFGAPCTPP